MQAAGRIRASRRLAASTSNATNSNTKGNYIEGESTDFLRRDCPRKTSHKTMKEKHRLDEGETQSKVSERESQSEVKGMIRHYVS